MSCSPTNHTCIEAMDSASLSVTARGKCNATALFNCGNDHARAAAAATGVMVTDGGVDGGELLLFIAMRRAVRSRSFKERCKKDEINEDAWF